MIESGITSRGQTTLPKAVREALSVRSGDRVRYINQDCEVRIVPVRPIARLFGVLRHTGKAVTLEDMERAIIDGASELVIAVDTNVVVRYLVNDDVEQAFAARTLLEGLTPEPRGIHMPRSCD